MVVYACLFHVLVYHLSGLYLPFNGYLDIAGSVELYVVIAFALMMKIKLVLF
jgi:hypothetical protein